MSSKVVVDLDVGKHLEEFLAIKSCWLLNARSLHGMNVEAFHVAFTIATKFPSLSTDKKSHASVYSGVLRVLLHDKMRLKAVSQVGD
jgi:hypothetical protein